MTNAIERELRRPHGLAHHEDEGSWDTEHDTAGDDEAEQ